MDSVDEENINGLMAAGDEMWNDNKEAAQEMIRQICDERFGPAETENTDETPAEDPPAE